MRIPTTRLLMLALFVASCWPSLVLAGWITLDVCADQYLLTLADDNQIAALSSASVNNTSALRARAATLPQHRGDIEQLVALRPEGVVSLWPLSPSLQKAIDKRRMHQIMLDGAPTLAASLANVEALGQALGQRERAERVIELARTRAAKLKRSDSQSPVALYVTPGGVSAGEDSFIHTVLNLGGMRNQMAMRGMKGWPTLRLERLVADLPDVLVRGFVDLETNNANYWGLFGHRIWRRLENAVPTIDLPGASVSCANWQSLSAAERLAEARVSLSL